MLNRTQAVSSSGTDAIKLFSSSKLKTWPRIIISESSNVSGCIYFMAKIHST